MPSTLFVRRVLLADAVVSGVAGLLMALGPGFFSNLLNLPQPLLRSAGLFLVLYGAMVGYLSTYPTPARPAVWGVIVANLLWAFDSILLLVMGWAQPNILGYGFVIFQAAVVVVFAELEYIGLKRMAAQAVGAPSRQQP